MIKMLGALLWVLILLVVALVLGGLVAKLAWLLIQEGWGWL